MNCKPERRKTVSLAEKRYESCHWTFSKGKLLSLLGANMYILDDDISADMYI